MKPEKLIFKGLKSYRERVEIDFSVLTENGLFGIFGSTGSGKSTILDAMFLALYGDFPESNVAASDFINAGSDGMFVEFTFSVKSGGVYDTYLVKREYKAKGEKKYAPQPKGIIYKKEGENYIPLSENATGTTHKVEEILGLKMEQFVKCIVVPQGQFSAFLSLNRSDRLKMMSGLFNLDKYGYKLQEKIRNDISLLVEKESRLSGQLTAYEEYTEESFAECEIKLAEACALYESENEKLLKITQEYNDFKNNYERHKMLLTKKNRLDILKKNSDGIAGLAAAAAKYETAVYSLEIYEKIVQTNKDETDFRECLAKQLKQLDELKKEFEKISLEQKRKEKNQESLINLKASLQKIHELEKDIESRGEIEKQLAAEQGNYRAVSKNIKQLSEKYSALTDELKKLCQARERLDFSEKSNELITEISASSGGIVNSEIEFLVGLKPYVFEEKKFIVSDRIAKLEKMISSDVTSSAAYRELKKLLEENDRLNAEISSKQMECADCNSQLEVLSLRADECVKKGKELRERLTVLNEKIAEVCGDSDYSEKIRQTEERINSLRKEIDETEKKFNEYSVLIPEKTAEVKITEEKIRSESIRRDALEKDLKNKLCGMNIAEAKAVVAAISDISAAKNRVEQYKTELNSLEGSIAELEKTLPEGEYTEQFADAAAEKKANAESNVKIFYENYIKLKKTLENISQKLKERCIIEKDYEELMKKKSLYSGLLASVKSSMLLEFVADEYLCDICFDANETLNILSGGKYGLRYEREFLVVDYNNGVERKTSTVSGGELFLVSLSLALSLSKSIIAKTNKPIEFFFLDEGFGSLDSQLVETVMDSLDRLRKESFTIGVISHVEALKERIAAKILVTGSDGSGSRVKVINY